MTKTQAKLLKHPVRGVPYNALRFAGFNTHGVALYLVPDDPQERGADASLRQAAIQFGAACFFCRSKVGGDTGVPLTIDHARSKKCGGKGIDQLFNLLIACEPCNKRKGSRDIGHFDVDAAARYRDELFNHVATCIEAAKTPVPAKGVRAA